MGALTKEQIERLNREGKVPHYDRAGNRIGLGDWADLCESAYADREKWDATFRVALDEVGDVVISTVWLPMNVHQLFSGGLGRPFQTRVSAHWSVRGTEERHEDYETEAEAFEGHRRWLRRVELGTWLAYEGE